MLLAAGRRHVATSAVAKRVWVACQSNSRESTSLAAHPRTPEERASYVRSLLEAKEASGKTFTQIAEECGVTNAYAAQLFHGQAQLHPSTEPGLRAAVPGLTDEQAAELRRAPMRGFDPAILQEPTVYRLYEAITHYGQAIKAIVNEECGDGIMSAIDVYTSIDVVPGAQGERRVVVSFNGKFLPHVEQLQSNNTAKLAAGKGDGAGS